MLYGYRVNEVPIAPLGLIKPDLRIKTLSVAVKARRVLVAVNLGCSVAGCAPPTPDIGDVVNVVSGAAKRFGGLTPYAHHGVLRELRDFTRKWLHANLRRLSDGDVPDTETWLAHTHYSETRKAELRRALEEHPVLTRRDLICNSFLKLEYYMADEWKYPRCINARSDACKVHFGPLVHAMEKELFALRQFVKYTPVSERPNHIYDVCYAPGATYIATDYSSFEAHFIPEVARSLEWQLYSYLLGSTQAGRRELPWIRRALVEVNLCRFKSCVVKVPGVRMSGDMWTSLGNGFSNLMLMLFCCHKKGANVTGVVEGDDGLFRVEGPAPTVADFAALGWTIKLETGKELGKMGFCKQYFDLDVRENVVNPAETLCKVGWSTSRLRLGGPNIRAALLRAKADSLVAQYPNAPVVRSLAEYIFRCVGFGGTRAYDAGWSPGYHDQERPRWTAHYRPDWRNYAVVEQVFGVSVSVQRGIEQYLDSLTSLQELDHPMIAALMRPRWYEFYARFSAPYPSEFAEAFST